MFSWQSAPKELRKEILNKVSDKKLIQYVSNPINKEIARIIHEILFSRHTKRSRKFQIGWLENQLGHNTTDALDPHYLRLLNKSIKDGNVTANLSILLDCANGNLTEDRINFLCIAGLDTDVFPDACLAYFKMVKPKDRKTHFHELLAILRDDSQEDYSITHDSVRRSLPLIWPLIDESDRRVLLPLMLTDISQLKTIQMRPPITESPILSQLFPALSAPEKKLFIDTLQETRADASKKYAIQRIFTTKYIWPYLDNATQMSLLKNMASDNTFLTTISNMARALTSDQASTLCDDFLKSDQKPKLTVNTMLKIWPKLPEPSREKFILHIKKQIQTPSLIPIGNDKIMVRRFKINMQLADRLKALMKINAEISSKEADNFMDVLMNMTAYNNLGLYDDKLNIFKWLWKNISDQKSKEIHDKLFVNVTAIMDTEHHPVTDHKVKQGQINSLIFLIYVAADMQPNQWLDYMKLLTRIYSNTNIDETYKASIILYADLMLSRPDIQITQINQIHDFTLQELSSNDNDMINRALDFMGNKSDKISRDFARKLSPLFLNLINNKAVKERLYTALIAVGNNLDSDITQQFFDSINARLAESKYKSFDQSDLDIIKFLLPRVTVESAQLMLDEIIKHHDGSAWEMHYPKLLSVCPQAITLTSTFEKIYSSENTTPANLKDFFADAHKTLIAPKKPKPGPK